MLLGTLSGAEVGGRATPSDWIGCAALALCVLRYYIVYVGLSVSSQISCAQAVHFILVAWVECRT